MQSRRSTFRVIAGQGYDRMRSGIGGAMESFQGSGGGDVSELGSLVQESTMLTGQSALYLLVLIIPRHNVCIDSSYYSYYIGTGRKGQATFA